MKTFNSLLVTSLLCTTTQAYAGYNCPAASSTGGGWTPPECTQAASVICADCGTVDQVSMIEVEDASGLGAAAGAVAGGLLGNQVGKGKGRTLSTIIGAVGGGVAGHYGEKYLRKKNHWDVIVLMEDGSRRSVSFDTDPGFQAGDKVKVGGGTLTRR